MAKQTPLQLIKDYVDDILQQSYGLSDGIAQNEIKVDDGSRGQLATSVAIRLAAKVGVMPTQLAQTIADELNAKAEIENTAVVGGGYVNIFLTNTYWLEWLNYIASNKLPIVSPSGQRVSLEFVSANPTGPLVLVNAWQAFYGDVLANIFKYQGYIVQREYYFNDGGSQIVNLGLSIQQANGKKLTDEEQALTYKGEYIKELATKIEQDIGSSQRVVEAQPYDIGSKAADLLFDVIKAGLLRSGVVFDSFFSENKLNVDECLKLLAQKDALAEYDGAIWLKSEVAGSSADRVLVRSGGAGATYLLKDIAYQLDRLKRRKFDRAITIVGADHHAETIFLLNCLKFLGFSNFTPLATQMVRLIKDGKEYKMSKRSGNYILLEEFLDVVPSDVARFYFISKDINSHFDLDLDLVRSQTKNNPLYYCSYAYVRASSILSKAQQSDIHPDQKISHVLTPTEIAICLLVSSLPQIIQTITHSYKVHALLTYLQQLATKFHEYYESERILSLSDTKLVASKLAFVSIVKEQFEFVYDLVGIIPPEKM